MMSVKEEFWIHYSDLALYLDNFRVLLRKDLSKSRLQRQEYSDCRSLIDQAHTLYIMTDVIPIIWWITIFKFYNLVAAILFFGALTICWTEGLELKLFSYCTGITDLSQTSFIVF